MTHDDYPMIDAGLLAASISPRELVLPEEDALTAIEQFAKAGIPGIAWEGWLRHPDGRNGHSTRYQGTNGFFDPAECADTIRAASSDYADAPEVPGATLYFCLSPNLRPDERKDL
jgi:hypothetical protein